MYTKKEQQQVEDVFLTQIVVTSEANNIFKYDGKTYSSQSYNSGLDPDMSDFAITLYEIIYSKKIVRDGQIINTDFAGDTINTGIYKKGQRKKVKLKNRHCLANFWAIPYIHGRRREKPKRDYLDSYLTFVEEKILIQDDNSKGYHDFNEFKLAQFTPEGINSNTLVSQEISIRDRTQLLAKSEIGKTSWQYFNEHCLF